MDTKSPIIEKIKKRLALVNSSNEHEAALAASHAQRLNSGDTILNSTASYP